MVLRTLTLSQWEKGRTCYLHAAVLKSASGKALPPGLAKKAARGGALPPGWQKKIARGEVLPPAVYAQAQPLPEVVIRKLPPPLAGTLLVTIDGKLVRLLEATRTIIDVFELQ